MGKKVRAKPKNLRKAQERDVSAPSSDVGPSDAALQDASNSADGAAASAIGKEHCGHYARDSAHLDKVLLEILSSKHVVSCEHCREDAPRKKGGTGNKEKGVKQKKKGGASKGAAAKAQAEKSNIWVCLDCGRHFCGGPIDDTKPYGHARRHAKQDRHWWAARYDDPTVAYCLSCEKEVPIEMPKLETVVAATVDDKVVCAEDIGASGLVDPHANVIKGLPNLGNTCFFNAVLQCLLALDRLRRKMLGPDVPTCALAMSLKKLFAETSASNHAGGALTPKNLFSSICSKYPQFRGYQMQDSHELLRCFLDGLHTEETEARKLAEEASNAGVPTIVDSIFGGQLSSTVSSTECSHSSVKHDQFLDLSLPVPSKKPPTKSVSSPSAKRTKQSIRERNKNRRYGKVPARAFHSVESNKEQIQTTAERNNTQIPGSELEQVGCKKEPESSGCSESCASVSNQEQKASSNVHTVSWLDYVADADETKSEILDSADSTEAGHIWESTDAAHGPLHPQNNALPEEQILGSEHSGENTIDDAASLQPVILLPYKEFGTTAKEMDETVENSQNSECAVPPVVDPVIENNTQLAHGGDLEQDDYVGLGDMFNEPEVTSEVKKETGKTEEIDVMAWSSNSADDEVDDSNAPVSVEGCLSLYTEPELLSEPWLCEHCTNAARVNADETKNVKEMMGCANEIKDGEEMMTGGGGSQDDEELVMSCSKEDIDKVMTTDGCKKDIDQVMATDDCSENEHSDMLCKEEGCSNRSLADSEQNCDGHFPNTENVTAQRDGAVFTIDKTEQSSSQIDHKEHSMELKSLELESSSLSKQQHDSAVQYNDGHNVDNAVTTNAPLSCGSEFVSCSATDDNTEAEHVGDAEVLSSSLPPDTQKTLQSAKDNEDLITRNQGRRKRMKMVGKAQQVHGNKNKQKEDGIKVSRAAMRRILISKAPPVLTVNLNRFSQDSHGRYKKLKGHVRFKEMLDIQPFMDPRCKENNTTTYRLVGVVEHLGTMTGGHYIAYVRAGKIGGRQQQISGSKSWFYASDGQVREAALEEVLSCEAYILFYERVGD